MAICKNRITDQAGYKGYGKKPKHTQNTPNKPALRKTGNNSVF